MMIEDFIWTERPRKKKASFIYGEFLFQSYGTIICHNIRILDAKSHHYLATIRIYPSIEHIGYRYRMTVRGYKEITNEIYKIAENYFQWMPRMFELEPFAISKSYINNFFTEIFELHKIRF